MLNYECEKCGKNARGSEWNYITETEMGDNIKKIETINFSNYQEENTCYVCPYCGETCYVEDGHIKEIKVDYPSW